MALFPLFEQDGGEVAYVAATYKDETQALRTADRVRLSEQRLRLAQQAAGIGTFEWNVQTGVNTWTVELESMHGLRPGEFAGTQQAWESLVHPDDRASALGHVARAFETLAPMQGEWLVCWPDGSIRWIAGRFQVLKDDAGAPHGLIGVNIDITDHKSAEQTHELAHALIRESEQQLRVTLDSIGEAVIATDRTGRVTRMNPAAIELTGWDGEEALGQPLSTVFHVVGGPLTQVSVARLAEETTLADEESFVVARDGTERAIAGSVAPIQSPGGDVSGLVATFRDRTEEREAQRALRRSEARFRRLTDSGIVGIVISDSNGTISEANDAFLAMVGYSRADLLDGRLSGRTLNTPERDRTDAAAMKQLAATGVASPWEKELLRADGTRMPVLVGVASLDDATGECVAFVLDLAERKRAELALRDSEARKAAIMEAALDAIVTMDQEGNITDINRAAERMFGYDREELVGRSLATTLIPASHRQAHSDGLMRYLRNGEARVLGKSAEVRAMRRDGAEFPAEVAVVRIPLGGPPVFTGYIRDLTERKRAAEAEMLRREKEATEEAYALLRAVTEGTSDAIYVKDRDGRFLLMNSAGAAMAQRRPEEMVGETPAAFLSRDDAALIAEQGRHVMADGVTRTHENTVGIGSAARTFLVTNGARRDASGNITGIIGIAREITDRKRVENELRRAVEAAEAANEQLESFGYSVAHDLRAPIRAMSGFGVALREDYGDKLDAKAHEYLDWIAASGSRMNKIIEGLLSLARLTTGDRQEVVDMTGLARDVAGELRRSEPGRIVEFVLEDGLKAHGDPRLLGTILQNLLGNAWKFTRKRTDGRIHFGRECDTGPGTFFVRDNGAGFDMAYADQLFVPFRRLHTTEDFEGTGIGLATVHRIVRSHGGRIWAEGVPGEGATFRFTLRSAADSVR